VATNCQFPETSRLLVAFACILPFLIVVQGKKRKKILDGQPEKCVINYNYSFHLQAQDASMLLELYCIPLIPDKVITPSVPAYKA
jgi:hypothetical protein